MSSSAEFRVRRLRRAQSSRSEFGTAGERIISAGRPLGFTLLEVLLAMSILAVIVTVIYTSFSTAGRNVEQAETRRDSADLARTLIAKFSDDITNACCKGVMKGTIFDAKKSMTMENEPRFDSLTLTTLTNWRKQDSKEMDLWEVGYRFEERPDGSGRVLVRREKREIGVESTSLEEGIDYEVTDQIAELRLRYLVGSAWKDEWHSSSLSNGPKAVEIWLTMVGGASYLTWVEVGR